MKTFEKDSLKGAIIQHPPVFLNLEKSTELALTYIKEAADNGAKLIVFPETWLPAYPTWLDYAPEAGVWDHPGAKAIFRLLSDNSIAIGDTYFNQLVEAAKAHDVIVVIGANERVGNTLYNTIFYFNADGTYAVHRKLTPTYTERLVWGVGDGSTLSTIDTPYGTIGGLVCWEHWMPLTRAAMHAKHETVHIAQWPFVKDLHHTASRQYAFEGQCFVVAAGCIVTKGQIKEGIATHGDNEITRLATELIESMPVGDDDLLLRGGSAFIKPNHHYLTEPLYGEAGIIYAEMDLNETTDGHLFLDTDGHYSRPDVFQLTVDTRAKTNVTFE